MSYEADTQRAALREQWPLSAADVLELDTTQEYSDFQKHYRTVDVCHRSRGIRDVRIDLNEDDGCIGPVKGCVLGCGEYYCCCKGCYRLCCPTDHRHQVAPAPTVDMER